MSFNIDILGKKMPQVKVGKSKKAEDEIVTIIKSNNLSSKKITSMDLSCNGSFVNLVLGIKGKSKKVYRLKSINRSLKGKKKPMFKRVLDRLHSSSKKKIVTNDVPQVHDELFATAINGVAKKYSKILLERGAVFYKYRDTNYVVLLIKENVFEVLLFKSSGMYELKSKHTYTGKPENAIINFINL